MPYTFFPHECFDLFRRFEVVPYTSPGPTQGFSPLEVFFFFSLLSLLTGGARVPADRLETVLSVTEAFINKDELN